MCANMATACAHALHMQGISDINNMYRPGERIIPLHKHAKVMKITLVVLITIIGNFFFVIYNLLFLYP